MAAAHRMGVARAVGAGGPDRGARVVPHRDPCRPGGPAGWSSGHAAPLPSVGVASRETRGRTGRVAYRRGGPDLRAVRHGRGTLAQRPGGGSGDRPRPGREHRRRGRGGGSGVRAEGPALTLDARGQGFLDKPVLGWGPENYKTPYDQHMDLAFIRDFGNTSNDKPHNKVLEELVSGGIFGAASYLAIWLALAAALIRGRRSGEGLVALGVFGSLGAYFAQNFFLFDTPSSYWLWVLLVAWAAGHELRGRGERVRASPEAQATDSPLTAKARRARYAAVSRSWALLPLAVLVGAGVGFGVWTASLRPFQGAVAYVEIGTPDTSFAERLDSAQRSFDVGSVSANTVRRTVFVDLANGARDLTPADRAEAAAFVKEESERGLRIEPLDSRLLRSQIVFLQTTAHDSAELDAIDPLIQRLVELAPHKVTTQKVLVLQEILRERPATALELIEQYVAQAPDVAEEFKDVRRVAQAMAARG